MQTKAKDENIVMIWSSDVGDINDWKDWIKEEIYENGRYIDKNEYAEAVWSENEKANQEKYDNMPHKQYVAEHDAFIENFNLQLTDEELQEFIDDNYELFMDDIKDMNEVYLFDQIGYDFDNGKHCSGNLEYCDEIKGTILCIGEHEAAIVDGNSIVDCFKSYIRDTDIEYYVEKDTLEFKQDLGTETFIFREVNPSVSEDKLQKLIDNINNGKATKADIDKITKPMGKYIQQVYGFEVSHKDNKKAEKTEQEK